VRQEEDFNLGVFLTHPTLVLAALPCRRGEGFAEHYLALTELVPRFELFPVPLFSQVSVHFTN